METQHHVLYLDSTQAFNVERIVQICRQINPETVPFPSRLPPPSHTALRRVNPSQDPRRTCFYRLGPFVVSRPVSTTTF